MNQRLHKKTINRILLKGTQAKEEKYAKIFITAYQTKQQS